LAFEVGFLRGRTTPYFPPLLGAQGRERRYQEQGKLLRYWQQQALRYMPKQPQHPPLSEEERQMIRFWLSLGCYTHAEIARMSGRSRRTVGRILARHALNN
jgi:hypothetical protein